MRSTGSSLAAFAALLCVGPAHAAEIVVRLDQPGAPIPAIHGVNSGPLVLDAWRPFSTQENLDMREPFAAARIPESRTHDEGAGDMETLWAPRDENGLVFAGKDPADDANWLAEGLANLDARMTAADEAGVVNYLRCWHSRTEIPQGSGNFPFSTPPDDFDVWAQACVELAARMRDLGHVLEKIEVWNEPYYTEFWTGTPEQYLDLYEKTRAAAHDRFGDDIAVGVHSLRGPWGVPATEIIRQRNTNADPADDVVVDFWVAHQYLRRPHQLVEAVYEAVVPVVDGVPEKIPPMEQYFELVGLPVDLPIVVSEWNRGTGVGNEFARRAAGLPVLLGAMAYMVDMHPSMGPHDVVMGHLYSARGMLWDEGRTPPEPGPPRPAGLLWQAFGEDMVAAGLARVPIEGLWATSQEQDPDRGEELVGIAGLTPDGGEATMLLGWFDNRNGDLYVNEIGPAEPLDLTVAGAAPGPWRIEHARIVDAGGPFFDSLGAIEGVETIDATADGDGTFAVTLQVARNSVSLVRLSYQGAGGGTGGTGGTSGGGTGGTGGATTSPGTATGPTTGATSSAGEGTAGGGGCACVAASGGPAAPAGLLLAGGWALSGRRRRRP